MRARRKRRRRRTAESGWGRAKSRKPRSWSGWPVIGLLLLVAAAIGMGLLTIRQERELADARPKLPVDEVGAGLEAAEKVARAFLSQTDPGLRLPWVRNAEAVKARLAEYPEEARGAVGEIESVLGHQLDGGRSVSAFVVEFPTGNLRLLEVAGTPDGPRVDWDAYARHCTASWEDLWSGKAKRAVVRVFCEPSTERPEPFQDPARWTCFRMSSPDLPQAALGFAQVGQVREAMMKKVVLGTPNYRQRFTLEIVRHERVDEPLFEITRCLAVGWILGERDVEATWEINP